MIRENLNCFQNELGRFRRRGRLGFKNEISEPFEVDERSPGINQLRQDLAFGLETALPRARARM